MSVLATSPGDKSFHFFPPLALVISLDAGFAAKHVPMCGDLIERRLLRPGGAPRSAQAYGGRCAGLGRTLAHGTRPNRHAVNLARWHIQIGV